MVEAAKKEAIFLMAAKEETVSEAKAVVVVVAIELAVEEAVT